MPARPARLYKKRYLNTSFQLLCASFLRMCETFFSRLLLLFFHSSSLSKSFPFLNCRPRGRSLLFCSRVEITQVGAYWSVQVSDFQFRELPFWERNSTKSNRGYAIKLFKFPNRTLKRQLMNYRLFKTTENPRVDKMTSLLHWTLPNRPHYVTPFNSQLLDLLIVWALQCPILTLMRSALSM